MEKTVFDETIKIPLSIWKETEACIDSIIDNVFVICMTDTSDIYKQDKIKAFIKNKITFIEISKKEVFTKIRYCFKYQKLINISIDSILEHAVLIRATDIHITPFQNHLLLRMRVDGFLYSIKTIEKNFILQNQLKLKSNLDVAESRKHQSGSFNDVILDLPFNFRVSTHPTINGESIVIRLLEKEKTTKTLDELGFLENQKNKIIESIQIKQGLFLCTGPTGSGKTTTLYTILSLFDSKSLNIITLEDPVEYHMDFINQTNIQEGVIDFSEGLRSILRHDPDIILVGEIRDEQTAKLAIQAALTGHLVFATLHSKNINSVINRLKSLNVDENLINSCLKMIVNQRLVRKICKHCSGIKCDFCLQTGFFERIVIAELLDDTSMKEHALSHIKKGLTSKEECQKVIENFY